MSRSQLSNLPSRTLAWAFLMSIFVLFLSEVSHAQYPYGIMPAGANATDAGLAAKYAAYKTAYFQTCAVGTRVWRPEEPDDDTVSEGVAYGALMVAYLEPDATGPALMQQLINFYNSKLNSRGLMHWNVSCATTIQQNAATDAELDYALGLIKAHQRWPGNNFNTVANDIIAKILQYETDACGLKPGDAWGGCNQETSPSYMSTGYFPCFGTFTGNTAAWNTVRNNCYNQLSYWYNNYALPPDWINGTTGQHTRQEYEYDSARTPWRLALDYLWYGNTTAQNQCNKIVNNFKTTDPNPATLGDRYYYLSGAKWQNNHNAVLTGPAAVGAMVSPTHQAWLDLAYTNVKNLTAQNYYLDSWRLLSLMVLSGVFTNPCVATGPTATPTRTFTRTNTPLPATPTRTNTPIPPTSTSTRTSTPTLTRTSTPTQTRTSTSTNTPLANTSTPTRTNTSTHTSTRTSTLTPTRTSTNTPPANTATSTRTSTRTGTSTHTSTRTSTNTPVANTATSTRTSTHTAVINTATQTRTNSSTPTATLSATRTSTSTPTSTRTSTSSPTLTISPTRTSTATSTNTGQPTGTSTSTPTRTSSSSPTATPSATRTTTSTNTAAFTSTRTLTSTATASRTPTSSSTHTNTRTLTASPTSTNTGQPTATHTNTTLNTSTATRTATASATLTSTRTNTPTSTNTGAPTATATSTRTLTTTATQTATLTSTNTGAPTSTRTATATSTSTLANTLTSTPTGTSSSTPTRTATSTSTPTSTPLVLQVAVGPSSPSGGSALQGSSNVPVLEVRVTNSSGSSATLNSLTVTGSGSGNEATGVTTAALYRDNGDGAFNAGTDTLLDSGSFGADNGNVTFNFSTAVGAGSSADLWVVYSFSATGAGNYQAGLANNAALTGTGAGQGLVFTGAPITSSTMAVVVATPTQTSTPTSTATPTATATQSSTPTLPATVTPTPTATVQAGSTPIVFPNPITTGTVTILPQSYSGTSEVTVSIFTSAFKLVTTKVFPAVPAGQTVKVDLVDNWGQDLASGLFYVSVKTKTNKKTTSLIIVR